MRASEHPWYQNWIKHRKPEGYPWKDNFWGFVNWAEYAGYNPGVGDKIRQGMGVDSNGAGFYLVAIIRADGTERRCVWKAPAGQIGKQAISSAALLHELQVFHQQVSKLECDGKPFVVMPAEVYAGFLRKLGCRTDQITAFMDNFQSAEDSPIMDAAALRGQIEEDSYEKRIKSLWTRMHSSCYNEGSPGYNSIGRQGIKVYEEWHEYARFAEWVRGRRGDGTFVRREMGDDYSPANCEFV